MNGIIDLRKQPGKPAIRPGNGTHKGVKALEKSIMKTFNVHGVQLTSIQEIVFGKWCSNNGVVMNTLNPEQRKEIVEMFLRQAKIKQ